jgi:hypothetical protein
MALIGERAATRGAAQRKVAMRAPVRKGAIRWSSSLANRIANQHSTPERPRRTTRPRTRTLVDDLPHGLEGHAGWRYVGTAPLDFEIRRGTG